MNTINGPGFSVDISKLCSICDIFLFLMNTYVHMLVFRNVPRVVTGEKNILTVAHACRKRRLKWVLSVKNLTAIETSTILKLRPYVPMGTKRTSK
jgi:hypothetical protein